jgi:hypothetical protein
VFIVSRKLSPEEMKQTVKNNIPLIEAWFSAHPTRRVCRAETWHGRICKVRRRHVHEDMHAHLQQGIAEEKLHDEKGI